MTETWPDAARIVAADGEAISIEPGAERTDLETGLRGAQADRAAYPMRTRSVGVLWTSDDNLSAWILWAGLHCHTWFTSPAPAIVGETARVTEGLAGVRIRARDRIWDGECALERPA